MQQITYNYWHNVSARHLKGNPPDRFVLVIGLLFIDTLTPERSRGKLLGICVDGILHIIDNMDCIAREVMDNLNAIAVNEAEKYSITTPLSVNEKGELVYG